MQKYFDTFKNYICSEQFIYYNMKRWRMYKDELYKYIDIIKSMFTLLNLTYRFSPMVVIEKFRSSNQSNENLYYLTISGRRV